MFEVTVLPACTNKNVAARHVPQGVKVDDALCNRNGFALISAIIKAPFNRVLFSEIAYLSKSKKWNRRSAVSLLKAVANVLLYKDQLVRYLKGHGEVDVIYCYWNEYAAFAAVEVKRLGFTNNVVSRIHRHDLYEENNRANYLPLKRQYLSNFDVIFPLSKSAKNYISAKYDVGQHNLSIAALGVSVPARERKLSKGHSFHVVSCSFCVPVKRIDKIIASLEGVARSRPRTTIKWSHIGGGVLFNNLKEMTEKQLLELSNVEYQLLGEVDNKAVKEFYKNNEVDVFVNLSESEGVPVSVMEAMANGIPAVAPDVGGINSLVHNKNGILLSEEPTIDEAVVAIVKIIDMPPAERLQMRYSAYDTVDRFFNSAKNYPAFIEKLNKVTLGR